MGKLILPARGTVYVDANALIYRVEEIEPYLARTRELWQAVDAGTAQIVTSELTLLEVLVKPLRDADVRLQQLYQRLLTQVPNVRSLPISSDILRAAAQLRAERQLKTPDAIHAATALVTDCALFLTNDAGFTRVPALPVVLLSEIDD